MNNLSPDDIHQMAASFWLENGEAPTHLLLTPQQHDDFSASFVPKERINPDSVNQFIGSATPEANLIGSYTISNGCTIDIVRCVFTQNNHDLDLPKIMRL